jgi:hypothetical protein
MPLSLLGSRRLALSGLGLTALLLLGASAGQAADAFRAGGRSTRAVLASTDHLARAQARGQALVEALGIPAASHRAARLDDTFDHRTYDEVTSLDARGRELAISRFDLDGRVAMAVALNWQPSRGRALDAAGAARSAAAVAGAAGLQVAGPPDVRASAGAGGWAIRWTRSIGGVDVRGDGIRILLWPDGSFHGLSRTERPLDAGPTRTLTPAEARQRAATLAAELLGGAVDQTRVVSVEQAWVAPNDTFGPAGPDAPDEVLRLAWTVRLVTQGDLAERLRQVELWIDAGDGRLIGGDLVQ